MGIVFAEGIDGENQRSRYHKLFKRDVLATRYPDNVVLRDFDLSDSVHWILNNLGMPHFLTLTSPTFVWLTYEFLSSFRYTTPIGGSRTTGTAYFRIFNRTYAINQDQLADLLSFPHGEDFTCQHPLESDWESIALDFWQQLTGKTTTDWKGLKATTIQNSAIRYLHCILASTIFGQENTGNMSSKDLFLIYYALSRTKFNPTPFLLAHSSSPVLGLEVLFVSEG